MNIRYLLIVSLSLLLIIWILGGCLELNVSTTNEDISSPTMQPTNTQAFNIKLTPSPSLIVSNPPLPEFVLMFSPDNTISFETYKASLRSNIALARGIEITIIMDRVDWDTKKSLSLYIDGERISNETIVIGDGLVENGPFYLSWAPELIPVVHEAHFEVETSKGDVLEYKWHFVITAP
jgi:hypothetical protein